MIITGVSPTGIGADAARAIFQQNPKLLILASRNLENINAVINEIRGSKSVENVKPLLLDLSDLTSVRKAADELLRMTAVVDALINNAGVMSKCSPRRNPPFPSEWLPKTSSVLECVSDESSGSKFQDYQRGD